MDLYEVRKKLNMGIPLTMIKLSVTYYSRVSTDHLEQQNSLKNQIEHFDEMIKNNINWTYIDGYVDEGISGTTDYKRNNFMRMIDDAKNNRFDLIITKEISRFSRNTLDSIKYTRELLSYGVAVLFINDNINTALPDSELRLTIMASMAQDEIRRLSERVKFGMNRSIKNGNILGNNMLYGYKKDKNTGNLIIIDNEAKIIKELFNLYTIDNYSINKIVKLFNQKYNYKKWHLSTITRMLKNPKYKGYYCGKKTEIIDYMTKKVKYLPEKEWILYQDKERIPPIINEELWNRANTLLKNNRRFSKDNKKIYPLSSKIYCHKHNEIYHRRKQCQSDITWICSKHLKDNRENYIDESIRESEIYHIFDDILLLLNTDLLNVTNILLKLYKNKEYKEIINNKLNEKIIKDKLINLLIDKIIISKEVIKIYLKVTDKYLPKTIKKEYQFKRGFNTKCTKRYIINYRVSIYKRL